MPKWMALTFNNITGRHSLFYNKVAYNRDVQTDDEIIAVWEAGKWIK